MYCALCSIYCLMGQEHTVEQIMAPDFEVHLIKILILTLIYANTEKKD